MVSLGNRLRMAWSAFRVKPFEIVVEPYHQIDTLRPVTECDANWRHAGGVCANKAQVCMSRKVAHFHLRRDDHEHLCHGCAAKIRGLSVNTSGILLGRGC